MTIGEFFDSATKAGRAKRTLFFGPSELTDVVLWLEHAKYLIDDVCAGLGENHVVRETALSLQGWFHGSQLAGSYWSTGKLGTMGENGTQPKGVKP